MMNTKGNPPPKGATRVQEAAAPRKGAVIDTPLSRLRLNPYAWLNRAHIERWGQGFHLVTLAALASLLRKKGRTLGLTANEIAESTGLCFNTTRAHLRSFEAEGLATEDGWQWKPTKALRKSGHAARVELRNLPVLATLIGGAGFRLYCWDRLYTTPGGRLTVSFKRLAEAMGRNRTTVWRGYSRLREAGIRCGARLSVSVQKTATSLRRKLQHGSTPTGFCQENRHEKGVSTDRQTAHPEPRPPNRGRELRRLPLAERIAVMRAHLEGQPA